MKIPSSDYTPYDFTIRSEGIVPPFPLTSAVETLRAIGAVGSLSTCLIVPGEAAQVQGSTFTDAPVIAANEANTTVTNVAPIGDLLRAIKDTWQINMTEMAEILGVTRATLYNWQKGKSTAGPSALQHLQVLAAASDAWESTESSDQDFLLDYTGPQTNQESIREAMSRPEITAEKLRALVNLRSNEYRDALAQARTILGDAPTLPSSEPPELARHLNELWSENSKALHQAQSSSE